MKSTHRREMRLARERDYIAWEPDDPEPWAMPEVSLQPEQQQRDAKSDKESFREVRDE